MNELAKSSRVKFSFWLSGYALNSMLSSPTASSKLNLPLNVYLVKLYRRADGPALAGAAKRRGAGRWLETGISWDQPRPLRELWLSSLLATSHQHKCVQIRGSALLQQLHAGVFDLLCRWIIYFLAFYSTNVNIQWFTDSSGRMWRVAGRAGRD